MQELVAIRDGIPTTNSRTVAKAFNKQHKNVIRDILKITQDIDPEFNALNFEPVKYRDGKGEMRSEYILTKDGFTLLVMGYTGTKAMQFKIAYINAFNKMETALKLPTDPTEARLVALERCIDMMIGKITEAHPQTAQPPLMLPMAQCVSRLKEERPGTRLSVGTIQGLVHYQKIPFTRTGNRTLVNYDKLLEYLNGLKMPVSEAVSRMRIEARI